MPITGNKRKCRRHRGRKRARRQQLRAALAIREAISALIYPAYSPDTQPCPPSIDDLTESLDGLCVQDSAPTDYRRYDEDVLQTPEGRRRHAIATAQITQRPRFNGEQIHLNYIDEPPMRPMLVAGEGGFPERRTMNIGTVLFEGFINPNGTSGWVPYKAKENQIPIPCQGCDYYHGKDGVNCAVHPAGPVGDECKDFSSLVSEGE